MEIWFHFSQNVKRLKGIKVTLATAKSVSRKYNFATEARIKQLQQIQLKKRTASKCNWAVTAYNDWHEERLKNFNYDYGIYMADLNNLCSLMKEDLQYALCRFVPEVTKKKGTGLFPGKTLYQMIAAIQKH